jgi:two-component system KDP operon response regulator KdpE
MEKALNVLVVEDDPYICKLCAMVLRDEGCGVTQAACGREALAAFNDRQPDVILLDLGLPDIDGMELIRLFRARASAPIIVISARSEESEKIRALDLGADDYMCKPFHTGELMARVRVAQRRLQAAASAPEGQSFTCGALRVDFDREQVWVDDKPVHLTPIEYKLLRLLIQNQGKVLTHHYIQERVWGGSEQADAQNLRVFMANLRRKIESGDPERRYILTQVGIGYRFADR